MATIQITIDGDGNITGGDLNNATVGESVTWQVTGGIITSIGVAPGKTYPFSVVTAPGKGTNNQWTAVISGAGDYQIMDSLRKSKTPKIQLVSPMAVK